MIDLMRYTRHSPSHVDTMNDYERARESNVARNTARMRELGVTALADDVVNQRKQKASTSAKKRKAAETAPQLPRRTSSRARKPVATYNDDVAPLEDLHPVKMTRTPYDPRAPPETCRKSALSLPSKALGKNVKRHATRGHLVFADRADFTPNLTPAQVIAAGTWGGCYFHPRGGKAGLPGPNGKRKDIAISPSEFPTEWFEGIEKSRYANRRYVAETNMYGVKAGQDQEYWESKGWIDARDPRGWFQWYCRFFIGRRCDDDDRQISRWKGVCGAKGRWKTNLINKIIAANATFDDARVSPVVRQTLLHWACEVTESEVLKAAK